MRKKFACVPGRESADCGPAALATVALHYGLHVSPARIGELAGTDVQGTDLSRLQAVAEDLGFMATCGRAKPGVIDKIPLPAIAHFNDTPEGHFVVIHAADQDKVTIADPARGVLALPREEFMRRWSQSLLLLAPSSDFRAHDKKAHPLLRLLKLALGERRLLLQSVSCAVVMTLLGFGTAFFVQTVIDRVIPYANFGLLHLLGVGVFIVLGFRAFYGFLRQYLLAYAGLRIELSLGVRYVRHVLSLPIKFFDRRYIGDVFSRISDITSIRGAITGSLLAVLVDMLLLIFSAGFMIWYNLRLTVVVFFFVPIIALVTELLRRPMIARQREMREQLNQVINRFMEAVGGIRTLKVFTAEEAAYQKVTQTYGRMQESAFRTSILSSILGTTSTLLTGIASVALLWVGADLVMTGRATVGHLMFFYSVLGFFLGPLDRLAPSITAIQQAVIGAERLGEINFLDPEDANAAHKIRKSALQGEVEFKNVSFCYREGYPVLSDITLQIPSGKTIALMGETGSGKSSLINLITGFYDAAEGQILIDGCDVRDFNKESLRRHIGIVFQEASLLSGTIRENIALGNPRASLEEIQEAAKLAEAHDFIMMLPKRYDYEVGDRGVTLSSGQRQRIAIARALLRKPAILILDEATSNVDTITEGKILAALRSTRPDRTNLIVTHRLTTVVNLDLIVVLDKGRIVESGTHLELIQRRGKYHALWAAILPDLPDRTPGATPYDLQKFIKNLR